jgi:hypothetical protein
VGERIEKLYTTFVCDVIQRKSIGNHNLAIKSHQPERLAANLEWRLTIAIKQNSEAWDDKALLQQ